jgi:hypothetical protein
MPTSTYVALATTTLASATATVTFSSIPATYRDLILVFEGKSSSTLENTYIQLNGDATAGNYPYVLMLGTGSSAISAAYTARTWGEADTTGGNMIYQFMDYSATDKHKTVLFRTNRSAGGVTAQAGRWANSSAITSIALQMGVSQNFAVGSTFSLYGIEA